MIGRYLTGTVGLLMIWLVIGAWRLRGRRTSLGPAAGAMMHEMLSDDRREAIQIVLEERAAERDPEDRDGHLPDLAKSSRAPAKRSKSRVGGWSRRPSSA
jgi:hypothetical protein